MLPTCAANMHASAITNNVIATKIGMVYSLTPRLVVTRCYCSRVANEAEDSV